MTNFEWRVAMARRKQGGEMLRKARKGLAGLAIIGAAILSIGAADVPESNQRLVQTVYTVKQGDTLRSIAEIYLEKNTGGRRYILEFEEGIKQLNPWLLSTHGQIEAGEVLRINYWEKTGGEGE